MPPSEAVTLVASDPDLLREATAMEPMFRAEAVRPAGRQGVVEIVGPLEAMYRSDPMSPEAKAAWWDMYAEALMDVPMASLRQAAKEWLKQSKWMPKPSELRELALITPTPAAEACRRARAAIAYAVETHENARPKVNHRRVSDQMAAFRQVMSARRDDKHLTRAKRPAWMTDAQWDDWRLKNGLTLDEQERAA